MRLSPSFFVVPKWYEDTSFTWPIEYGDPIEFRQSTRSTLTVAPRTARAICASALMEDEGQQTKMK